MKQILVIILLVFACTFGQSQSSYWKFTYNVSIPTGEFGKFIESTSWRGASLEGGGYLSDNLTMGILGGWNVFYQIVRGESITSGNVTLTGEQYRYVNAFPLMLITKYYFGDKGGIQPFAGGGLGTYHIKQRNEIGLIAFVNNTWHFGVYPEIGVLIPTRGDAMITLSGKYNYAFKTKETINYGYFTITAGFDWLGW